MRQWITLVENQNISFEEKDGMVYALDGETPIAWYGIDHTYIKDGMVNVHANVDASYRNQGVSTRAYDWMEQHFAQKGLKLIPSDRLSDGAYQFWKKRSPSSVAEYVPYDTDSNALAKYTGSNTLWYSPNGVKRFNIAV